MRKSIFGILAVLLCIAMLVGCEKTPAQTDTTAATQTTVATESTTQETQIQSTSQTDAIVQMLHQEQALCAVAYVGYCGGSFAEIQQGFENDGLIDALPILAEIPEENFISVAGSELYLVIPRDDVGICVSEQFFDEETAEVAYRLTRSGYETDALLLRGNISDIFPNLWILIEGQGGESLEYSPSLSLMDGTLYVESSLIFDMTPYEALGIDAGPVVGDEDERIGMWFTEALNTAGDTMALELTMDYDGNATYAYGAPDGECYEFFSGSWYEEDDLIVLDLYGGAFSFDGEAEQYDFHAEFQWEYADGKLTLHHFGGMGLLYGLEGGTFEFYPSNRTALIGLWSVCEYDSERDSYIYFDLEFLADDTCSVLVHNGEGVTFGAYEGTWSVENGVLHLSAQMFSGSEYTASAPQTLNGTYYASFDYDAYLELKLIDGDVLTNYMEQFGNDYFEAKISFG